MISARQTFLVHVHDQDVLVVDVRTRETTQVTELSAVGPHISRAVESRVNPGGGQDAARRPAEEDQHGSTS